MQKSAVLAVLLAAVMILSGCEQIAMGRVEIDKLFIVRLVSVDEAPDGKIMVTITTKNLSAGGAGSEQQQKGESILAEGDTVFEAVRNLMVYSDRRPIFGHTEFILFSEAIAKKGLLPYLDFFSRMSEIRGSAKIYIVKGATANSVVKKSNTQKMFIGDRIINIEENVRGTSYSSIVTLNEAMIFIDNNNLDLFLPSLDITDTMTTEEKQQDTSDILLSGYAIFNRDKLLTFSSKEVARGINWLMGRIKSGIIIVKSKGGEKVSLMIVDSNVKLYPMIQGNELRCTVDISFTTTIGEVMGSENIIEHNIISYLTEQQEKVIKQEVERTINIAQANNSDHFSNISKFIIKYPMMRDYFNENWKDLFPDIKFDVKVKSRIKGTYLINEPTGSSEEAAGE